MNSRWSDNLRKRMEAHEEPSPDGLWEDIEQIITKGFPLQAEEHSVPLQSGRKTMLLWAKRIGAAAAILFLLFFIGNLFLKEEHPHSPVISQKSVPASTPSTSTETTSTALASTETAPAESGTPEPIFIASSDIKTDHPFIDKESVPVHGKQNKQPEEEAAMEEKNANEHSLPKEQPRDYEIPAPNTIRYPATVRRNKPARWETGLYASNTSSGSSKEYNGYRSFLSEEISGANENAPKESATPLLVKHPHEGIVAANKQSPVYTEAQHRLPVTMGASIKYNINRKWSLTSGVTYTILSSQLRSGSHSHHYSSIQTLHNIGIPLSVNYNLLKRGNMALYLSGGGAVEKNVYGKLTTDYVLNDKLESTEKENISIDPLQWSINSSVGIEYWLFHNIGLYAEPGVIYYFKNRSEIETIYKEKPLNFNIRVGLRFSLGD